MGMGGFCNSLFGELKELAKQIDRQVAQNMMLPKELLGIGKEMVSKW